MTWNDAVEGIGRDLSELAGGGPLGWLMLAAIAVLPFAAALAIRGTRLAWLALALWLLTVAAWVMYYAADLWADPGLAGFYATLAPVLAGWLVLGVGLIRSRRRIPTDGRALPGNAKSGYR